MAHWLELLECLAAYRIEVALVHLIKNVGHWALTAHHRPIDILLTGNTGAQHLRHLSCLIAVLLGENGERKVVLEVSFATLAWWVESVATTIGTMVCATWSSWTFATISFILRLQPFEVIVMSLLDAHKTLYTLILILLFRRPLRALESRTSIVVWLVTHSLLMQTLIAT